MLLNLATSLQSGLVEHVVVPHEGFHHCLQQTTVEHQCWSMHKPHFNHHYKHHPCSPQKLSFSTVTHKLDSQLDNFIRLCSEVAAEGWSLGYRTHKENKENISVFYIINEIGGRTESQSDATNSWTQQFVPLGQVPKCLEGLSFGSPEKSPIIPTQTAVGSLSCCPLINHRTTPFLHQLIRQVSHSPSFSTRVTRYLRVEVIRMGLTLLILILKQ